jgi:hypothetical protein
MEKRTPYRAKTFDLAGLTAIWTGRSSCISSSTKGYVEETNRRNDKIGEILKDRRVDQEEMPAYSELTRGRVSALRPHFVVRVDRILEVLDGEAGKAGLESHPARDQLRKAERS